jgi:ankyrin repeat protein
MVYVRNNITRGILCAALAVSLLAGCGSLSKSAINGDLDGVRKYHALGEKVNQVDKWGWTPLMWAAYYNYYDVAKFLLENGANVNARVQKSYRSIENDSTALIIASYYGHDGMVRLLLSHGADKSITNARGMTAMDIASHYNLTAVIDLLGNAPVRKAKPVADDTDTGAPQSQTILLTDGSRIVGKILSQTRMTVTVQTKYTTMTIDKSKISEMKYK